MILYTLAILDILSAIILVLVHYRLAGNTIALLTVLYLAVKAVMFMKDIASFIDLAAAIYITLLLIGLNPMFLTFIFAIYLLQKAAISFLF